MDDTLRELKDSVGKILQNIEQQAIKREESDVLLHILSSKLDIQGQKLQKLETDLRNVKEMVETNLENKEKDDSDDSPLHIKEEILSSIQINAEQVKCSIKDEFQKLGNACLKSSSDIIARVDAVDSVILEVTTQMKEVASHIEDVDKGIRRVENSSNKNSVVLKSLQENFLCKDEVKNTFKDLKDASVRQLEVLNQIMGKEELKMTLDSVKSYMNKIMDNKELKSSLDSVSSSINAQNHSLGHLLKEQKFNQKLEGLTQFTQQQAEDIKKELTRLGSIKEMVKRTSEAILDQTVTESQITREMVRNTRKIRDTYICDLHIKDFKDFKSGQTEESRLWYIDQMDTHLRGSVSCDGKMLDIWIVNGRYPAVLGLDRKVCSVFKVRVKLVKPGRKDWVLGSEIENFDENNIFSDMDGWKITCGKQIAKISQDKLISQGWVDGYDKVLFRFEIIVLL